MITAPAVRRPEPSRLPPELLGSVPRDVRLTSGGVAVVVTAIVLAIGALASAIVMLVVYTRSESERQLREQDRVTAVAEVVQIAVGRGEEERRTVTYRYDVDGRRYTGTARLRESDRRDLKNGDPIQIGYLASRPQTNWLTGYERRGFPIWTIPLVSLSLLLAAAAVARSVRRQRILLSEGRAAQARVISTKKVHRDHGTAFRISYEFQTLSGAKQTSRCEVGKTPPPIGTVIPIVYHRDKPQWSAAYPLKLVRPVRFGT
jgi:uncharacterized protein DUF3592